MRLRKSFCLPEEKYHSDNFNSYELPRFSSLPKIETVILDRPDQPPQGGGEPAIICMGAVIANAIFDATGARLYQLPMTPAAGTGSIAKSLIPYNANLPEALGIKYCHKSASGK